MTVLRHRLVNVYLIAVFSLAALALVLSLGVVTDRGRAQPPRPPGPPRVAARLLRPAPRPAPLSRPRPGRAGRIGTCVTSTSARSAGPTCTRAAPSTTSPTSTTCRRRGSTSCAATTPPSRRSPVRGWSWSARSSSTSCPSPWPPARCSSPPGSPRSGRPPSRWPTSSSPSRPTRTHPSSTPARRPCSRRTTSARSAPAGSPPTSASGSCAGPSPRRSRTRAAPPRPAPWADAAWREDVHVRFSDVDLLGHVNNVRYLDYVQEATTNLLLDCLREAAVDGHVELVVARTEIDYLGQMNLRPEPYDVWARVHGRRHDVGGLRGRDPRR